MLGLPKRERLAWVLEHAGRSQGEAEYYLHLAIDVSVKEVRMAEALVDSMAGDFDPAKYRDDYREQVLDLIRRKAEGEEFEAPAAAAAAPKVVDLMAALEASVKAAKDARKRHPAAGPAEDGSETASASESAPATAKPKRVRKSA